MNFEQIRLAIYQAQMDMDGEFNACKADDAFNWITGQTSEPAAKPVIPQPGNKPEATKPQLEYDPREYTYIREGQCANVHTLNHPIWGKGDVVTSTVLVYNGATGVFETRNTVYVPAGQKA